MKPWTHTLAWIAAAALAVLFACAGPESGLRQWGGSAFTGR